jgi:LysM repeat protein
MGLLMKKTFFAIFILFLVFNVCAQEKHKVVKGDTLWDIAGKYYNDNFGWPLIWKYNTFINNPDLIYPNETIVIPGYTKGGDKLTSKSNEVFKLGKGVSSGFDSNNKSSSDSLTKIKYAFNFKNTFAFETVLEKKPKFKVISTQSNKAFVTKGDFVWINAGSDNNTNLYDKFYIYSLQDKIDEGHILYITGIGEVVKVKKDHSLVRITNAFDSITKGHYIHPYFELDRKNPKGFLDVNSNTSGKIVYIQENHVLSGEGYRCIINIGENKGVKRGDIFEVYRYAKEGNFKRYEKLGEAQVIFVNKKTSTLLIIKSLSELHVGDTVNLSKIAIM